MVVLLQLIYFCLAVLDLLPDLLLLELDAVVVRLAESFLVCYEHRTCRISYKVLESVLEAGTRPEPCIFHERVVIFGDIGRLDLKELLACQRGELFLFFDDLLGGLSIGDVGRLPLFILNINSSAKLVTEFSEVNVSFV